uniref:SH3 domain-containing protein n=1 Tax=Balaenoptera musculus TaxID=9771 RepID=A0A8C0DVZ9_BALMU
MHLIAITGYEVRPRPCPAGGAHEPGAGPKAAPLPGWALHAHHPERHRQTLALAWPRPPCTQLISLAETQGASPCGCTSAQRRLRELFTPGLFPDPFCSRTLARFKPCSATCSCTRRPLPLSVRSGEKENGEGYEKAPSYSFKQSLNMTAVGITRTVKGDTKKFEIWYNAREEVAPTPEVKAAWVSEIRKVLTSQLQACREASQHRALEQSHSLPLPAPAGASPSKGNTKNVRKLEERKTDPLNLEGYVGPALLPRPPEKGRDDAVTSSTSESSALSKKRFTLQSFAALKGQKASPTSPDKKAKRHQVKSDPTPFGLRGWSKTSHPSEAPEDNDGWSSAEEPINSSDAEEEGRVGLRKLVPGKYTVTGLDEKGGPDALVLRSGDEVELVQEGDEGLWFVRNLSSGGEGWLPARKLSPLLGQRGAPGCLSSPESSAGSALLSASSSCSESCAAALADLQG